QRFAVARPPGAVTDPEKTKAPERMNSCEFDSFRGFRLRRVDLNHRPPGYEPGELGRCSTPRPVRPFTFANCLTSQIVRTGPGKGNPSRQPNHSVEGLDNTINIGILNNESSSGGCHGPAPASPAL